MEKPNTMKNACFVLCLAVLLAVPAWANSDIRDAAIAQYPFIDNTRLDSCTLCHTAAPALNPYGTALDGASLNFMTIEPLDSDSDDFTNIQEIRALAFPGNSTDVPSVPDVVGMTQTSAQTAITNVGFAVGTITQQASDTVPAGDVISQLPTAGSAATAGTEIDLVVSTGAAAIAVPDVVGLTQAAATTAITNAGLTLGTVTQQASDTVPVGQVISQLPTAGTLVAADSEVNITVSAGPSPVSVPDLIGLTQAAAETAITNLGLAVGTVTEVSNPTVPVGQVFGQSPPSGTLVAEGTEVDLFVSAGPIPITVPNVVGLTEAAAMTALTSVGLTVGTISQASSNTVPAGQVISQNPAAGSTAASGAAVALVISTGPAGATGSLRVLIEPAAARAEGAQWRVDGGVFRDSGETITLSAGTHTLSFRDISCTAGCFATCDTDFQRPDTQTITIVAGETLVVNATYVEAKELAAAASSGGDILILSLIALGFLAARRILPRNSKS